MRIGIAGAHRVGKSKLAKAVAKDMGLTFIDGGCSPVFEAMGLKPTEPMPFEQRLQVQNEILARYVDMVSAAENFITDRTPLDFIAYLLAELSTEVSVGLSDETHHLVTNYIETCLSLMATLDTVVLIQPGIPISVDESKACCQQPFVEKINAIVTSYAYESSHDCQVILVPRGLTDFEERRTAVLDLIRADLLAAMEPGSMAIN